MKSNMTPDQLLKAKLATERRKNMRPKPRPIWRRVDIDESKSYVLLLIENESGLKDYELRELSQATDIVENARQVFITNIIPIDLVLNRNLTAIAREVKLQNGEVFAFDSQGGWMTEKEIEEFERSFDR